MTPASVPAATQGRAVSIFAALAAAIAFIGLSGSLLKHPALVISGATVTNMVPNTGLCLLVLSAGLLAARKRVRLSQGLGVAVVLFVGIVLSQYITGLDYGIDRLVLSAVSEPSRTSPNAGGALILFALALALFGMPGLTGRAAAASAGGALGLATLAFLGYATGLTPVFRLGALTGMSLPTAAALLCLTIGFFALLHSKRGPIEFAPPLLAMGVIILVTVIGSSVITNNELLKNYAMVRHSLEIREFLRRLGEQMETVDRIERIHYNTSDPGYSRRLALAEDDMWSGLTALRALVTGEPEQFARIDTLKALLREKVERLKTLFNLGSQGQLPAETRKREVMLSLESTDAVIDTLDAMLKQETQSLASHSFEAERLGRQTRGIIWLAGGLSFVLLVAAAVAMERARRSRETAREILQAANRELEDRVAARTALLEERNVELREAEESMRFLADTMPYIVWATRPDGAIQYYNRAWLEYTGLSGEETISGKAPDILHPEDREAALAEWVRARATGNDYERENRYRRAADGTYRWHFVRARAQRDALGRIVRWVGSSIDIHDQKSRAEELTHRVAESAEELRAILEGATHFIFSMNAEGLIRSWNAAAERTLGWQTAEMIGHPANFAWHDSGEPAGIDSASGVGVFLERAKRGETLEREWRLSRKDGSTFPAWLGVTPLRDEAGRFAGAAFIGHDLTERKRLEANLAEARDAAVEASRLKSEFLANMSHELRTPMNGIIGMSGLLMETRLSVEQQEMGEMVLHSAEALLTIINDILDFSKIEAGRMQIDAQPFDLRRMAEDCALLLAPRAHEKGVELILDYDANLPERFVGDGGRLRQIITSLAGNAVKFTSRGEVVVRVAMTVGDTVGCAMIRVEVRDTGDGIPPDAQGKLFEPFTQADAATTRRFGGTGLGLAISRQLIEMMGGTIGFESRLGEGSLFWFRLELPFAEDLPSGESRADLSGRRFLVVDDNANCRRVLAARLAAMGARTECVSGVKEVFDILKNGGSFDAILLDWHMPEMDGLTLARELRRRERRDHPGAGNERLVLLSSASHALANGENLFDAVLTKPVRSSELRRCLLELSREGVGLPAPALTNEPRQGVFPGREAEEGLDLLLVEDNVSNQYVARLLLERLGHRVEVISNGEAALASMSRREYDAVFMDCQMPVLDGYETTRQIRSGQISGINTRTPVIALTANAMASDRLKCLSAGMNDFVTKPIRLDELREVLKRCRVVPR